MVKEVSILEDVRETFTLAKGGGIYRVCRNVSSSIAIGRVIDTDAAVDVQNRSHTAWSKDSGRKVEGITVGVCIT